MNLAGATGDARVGWGLVILGLIIAGVGLIWVFTPSSLRLGRLPGDIVIERKNSRFYLPVTTCLLISVVLSLLMWVVRALIR